MTKTQRAIELLRAINEYWHDRHAGNAIYSLSPDALLTEEDKGIADQIEECLKDWK